MLQFNLLQRCLSKYWIIYLLGLQIYDKTVLNSTETEAQALVSTKYSNERQRTWNTQQRINRTAEHEYIICTINENYWLWVKTQQKKKDSHGKMCTVKYCNELNWTMTQTRNIARETKLINSQ